MTTGTAAGRDSATQVRAAVAALDEAFNRRDVDAVLTFYDLDAVMVVRPGLQVCGHTALREAFASLVHEGSCVQIQASEVLATGDTALFIARWSIHRARTGSDEVHIATSVLRRATDGRWRVLIDNAFGPRVLDASCP